MVSPVALILLLQAVLSTTVVLQESGRKVYTGDTAVALDQLSIASRGRDAQSDSAVDLAGPQPATPNAAAKVTSTDISTRAEGRALATAPVAGDDSCDPPRSFKRSAICGKRLETRVNGYIRPGAAPITPEGRLLLLISPGNSRAATTVGGRQIETSGLNDPNGAGEQLAGALQEKIAEDAAAAAGAKVGPLPAGVPPIVALPRN